MIYDVASGAQQQAPTNVQSENVVAAEDNPAGAESAQLAQDRAISAPIDGQEPSGTVIGVEKPN